MVAAIKADTRVKEENQQNGLSWKAISCQSSQGYAPSNGECFRNSLAMLMVAAIGAATLEV